MLFQSELCQNYAFKKYVTGHKILPVSFFERYATTAEELVWAVATTKENDFKQFVEKLRNFDRNEIVRQVAHIHYCDHPIFKDNALRRLEIKEFIP
jgi:hypothetical protein